MKPLIDDLKKAQFFNEYDENHLKKIIEMSSIKKFAVEEIIFEQYKELTEVFVLLSGSVSLGINLVGKKRIHLGTIEEGQLFSWSAVFSPYISTAWIMAVKPVKVLAIDAKLLNKEFTKDCEFGLKTMTKIAQTISRRLTDTRFQLMNQMML